MHKKLTHDIYHPSEDTFFLADYILNKKGNTALDIGTGSGYLFKILLHNFKFVVATDINFYALTKMKKFNCICCSNVDAISYKFDLIVCNPPYLPSLYINDPSIDGGIEGLEISLQIIKSAKTLIQNNGKLLLLVSTLSNYNKLLSSIINLELKYKIVKQKKLFFEKLLIVEITLH